MDREESFSEYDDKAKSDKSDVESKAEVVSPSVSCRL